MNSNKVSIMDDMFGASQFVFLNATQQNRIFNDMKIPDQVLYYIFMINFWSVGLGVSCFGIVTNILNIITFLRQSLKDAVNISLLGLAITDFLSLFSLSITDICFIPSFKVLDLPFVVKDFLYIWAWQHIMLTRITSWITAYIIFGRCLCVTLPLKVKMIITPKRTIIYILTLYIIMLISVIPVYYSTRAVNIFDAARNKTLMAIAFVADRNSWENIAFILNCIIPASSFAITTVCTIILVRKLREKQKWRQKSTADGQTDTISRKDTKVIRMVVFISTVFIICYTPGVVAFIWAMFDTQMRIDGIHLELLFVIFSILFHLESINASFGIFTYLRMSSKYKKTFIQTFCGRTTSSVHKKNSSVEGTFED